MDDLSQFHGVFFDEAAEHLAAMETLLLGLALEAPDPEHLNAIFRAAHSIKGGAATFGFRDMADLTHEMETVFDHVRKGQMALSRELVDAFLAAGDTLKAMLAERRGDGPPVDAAQADALCARLRAFLQPSATTQPAAQPEPAAPRATVVRPGRYEIAFGPFDARFTEAALEALARDLAGFGELRELEAAAPLRRKRKGARPGAARGRAARRERRYELRTELSEAELADALAFMAEPDRFRIRTLEEPVRAQLATPEAAAQPEAAQPEARQAKAALEEPGFGLFVDPATLPAARQAEQDAARASGGKVVELRPSAPQPASGESSIRVSVEKVDQLINLVGELVITQAMLAQTVSQCDPIQFQALHNGLAQLERNTRDLQEAAMAIRMVPMSVVFSRFPRLVRDTAAKLGKEVELVTAGEGTELDKGLIERIVDPLTHLVRNSLDHGIEAPAEREAQGKVRKGTIALRAFYQGGAIVIEVADDGRGLQRERILAKARERGMAVSDAMSDAEVWNLIFEAGFSTAEQVTEVSGRGVGMDVVKRNILSLGGRIELDSVAGAGTRITVRLPLTLAILDGMSVRVGKETYIVPLAYIAESLQPEAGAVRALPGRGPVIAVRGEYVPVLTLEAAIGARGERTRYEEGILLILEAEGAKTALFVDELVGQQQVVIKSLETNYRKVAGISGATIMGDGRVALILDVAYLVGRAHTRAEKAA